SMKNHVALLKIFHQSRRRSRKQVTAAIVRKVFLMHSTSFCIDT
ncbi:hypothetical protein DOY81_006885, partial [Sarcophaga bullata]